MPAPTPDGDLVIATPERVSFDYRVAGVGTRALAQALDLLIVGVVLVALLFVASGFAALGQDTVATLVAALGAFAIVFGYFWVSEAVWSGQTVGKRALRLRAIGDGGQPITFAQAGIRNLVRVADFLPYFYGVGMIVLFANGKGKRLGDLAAGTIVVKDSDFVALWQLPAARRAAPPATPSSGADATPVAPAPAGELALRRLSPELRRLVSVYGMRRSQLSLDVRVRLADQVQSSLRAAAPDVFAAAGPLAALDHLADLESS